MATSNPPEAFYWLYEWLRQKIVQLQYFSHNTSLYTQPYFNIRVAGASQACIWHEATQALRKHVRMECDSMPMRLDTSICIRYSQQTFWINVWTRMRSYNNVYKNVITRVTWLECRWKKLFINYTKVIAQLNSLYAYCFFSMEILQYQNIRLYTYFAMCNNWAPLCRTTLYK